VAAVVRARALADRAALATLAGAAESLDQAQQALVIARQLDEPALLARALTARGYIASFFDPEAARAYLAEALGLARALGDRWRLSQILGWQALAALMAGDLIAVRSAGQEGRDLAEAIGNRFHSFQCRWCLGVARCWQGDLAGAAAQFAELVAEAQAAHDGFHEAMSLATQGFALAYQGDTGAARASANAAIEAAAELGGLGTGLGYRVLVFAALAAGDAATAQDATEATWQYVSVLPAMAAAQRPLNAEAALAGGDLAAARRWADDAVSTTIGVYLTEALATRARVAIAQGEPEQAERDAQDALTCAAEIGANLSAPDILECLAALAAESGSHREAARLFGAAHGIRQGIGAVRFKVWDARYEASVAAVGNALGEADFDSAWAEGAALSTEEAIAYAQRGRGQRKRPTNGWAALTPTELDVVRLVTEGLANKDIATRLFVSPRTVQTHLTHVYTKLGLSSRVQLVQEAARHN
jgi:DNA-binding CsgD family transcriptional regulator